MRTLDRLKTAYKSDSFVLWIFFTFGVVTGIVFMWFVG